MEAVDSFKTRKHFDLILIISVVSVWFFSPLVGALLLLPLWISFKQKSQWKDTFIIFMASLTFGLIAYTGQSIGVDETDIARYHFYYTVVSDIESIGSFFVLMVLDGGSNPVFYVINFLISRVFPLNVQVHIMFWVTVTYFFTLMGVYKLSGLYARPVPTLVTKLLIFIFLIGIMPFFTITEIIKQSASVSIFFYALSKKLLNEKHSLLWLLVALLVHVSSIMLLPVFFFYNNRLFIKNIYLLFFISIVLSFFNFNVILTSILSLLPGGALLATAKEYQNVEVWTIGFRIYSTFFFYILLLLPLFYDYYRTKKLNILPEYEPIKKNILMILFLSFMILLINRGNVHNFIRYVFGLYPFYMLVIIFTLKTQFRAVERYSIAIVAICFFTYSNVKLLAVQTSDDVNYANSYFDNSWKNLLTSNVYEYLSFEVR
ncbi:EpsG family protein [Pedobacter ginsengisoli]|uniref:EpsG family protein n=1 Tax=Pedobacter ginsengisoli TaxID=363852 RepID=UPI00254EDFCC|nr:EpsG family protein [Pedobacter ginsengisoli]